jgi:hypothetical protein
MRSLILTGMITVLLAGPCAAATTATSWGKPGVTLDQYRTDASECGHVGGNMDVSNTEAAGVFKRATRELETNEAGLTTAQGPAVLDVVISSARVVEGTRPKERIQDVKGVMVGAVEKCLVSRGYVKFWLTPKQRERLGHLKIGSDARRLYLYRLAKNPDILESQSEPPAAG